MYETTTKAWLKEQNKVNVILFYVNFFSELSTFTISSSLNYYYSFKQLLFYNFTSSCRDTFLILIS